MTTFEQYFKFTDRSFTKVKLLDMLSFVGAITGNRGMSKVNLIDSLHALQQTEKSLLQAAFSELGVRSVPTNINQQAPPPAVLLQPPPLPQPDVQLPHHHSDFIDTQSVPSLTPMDPLFPIPSDPRLTAWWEHGVPMEHSLRIDKLCQDQWRNTADPRNRYFSTILQSRLGYAASPDIFAPFLDFYYFFGDITKFDPSFRSLTWNDYCHAQQCFSQLINIFYPAIGLLEDAYWRSVTDLHRNLLHNFPNMDLSHLIINFDKAHRASNFQVATPTKWVFPITNNVFNEALCLSQNAKRRSLPTNGTTDRPSKKAKNEVCFSWNANGCAETCHQGRQHVCAVCRGDHRTCADANCQIAQNLPPILKRLIGKLA
jgi:hypothetical protein